MDTEGVKDAEGQGVPVPLPTGDCDALRDCEDETLGEGVVVGVSGVEGEGREDVETRGEALLLPLPVVEGDRSADALPTGDCDAI